MFYGLKWGRNVFEPYKEQCRYCALRADIFVVATDDALFLRYLNQWGCDDCGRVCGREK